MSPYKISGPALISFSGGRTSGYMLRQILDAHGGELPRDVRVAFADTGKERPETYRFVRQCAEQWNVRIPWVWRPGGFEQLIRDKQYLPNPVARFCTSDLKVKPLAAFMRRHGFDHWTMVVGLRADEPRRVAKRRGATEPGWDYALPLADAGVAEGDVLSWWSRQPFDLQLRPDEGNCDLCFLKGREKRIEIMRRNPGLARWWIDREEEIGARFRARTGGYDALKAEADRRRKQIHLPLINPDDDPTDIGDCMCTD